MAITTVIKMTGFLLVDFDKKAKELKTNRRKYNLAAAVELRKWIGKNFDKEGGMHEQTNLKWKELSESTIAQRRKGKRKGKRDKILRDTGALSQKWEINATVNQGIVKSKQDYSAVHEFGEGNIPIRKILPTDAQAIKIVQPVYEKNIIKLINKK